MWSIPAGHDWNCMHRIQRPLASVRVMVLLQIPCPPLLSHIPGRKQLRGSDLVRAAVHRRNASSESQQSPQSTLPRPRQVTTGGGTHLPSLHAPASGSMRHPTKGPALQRLGMFTSLVQPACDVRGAERARPQSLLRHRHQDADIAESLLMDSKPGSPPWRWSALCPSPMQHPASAIQGPFQTTTEPFELIGSDLPCHPLRPFRASLPHTLMPGIPTHQTAASMGSLRHGIPFPPANPPDGDRSPLPTCKRQRHLAPQQDDCHLLHTPSDPQPCQQIANTAQVASIGASHHHHLHQQQQQRTCSEVLVPLSTPLGSGQEELPRPEAASAMQQAGLTQQDTPMPQQNPFGPRALSDPKEGPSLDVNTARNRSRKRQRSPSSGDQLGR